MESFKKKDISFIGEQVGMPEAELKTRLVTLWKKDTCDFRAYLTQVKYKMDSETKVALCIHANTDLKEKMVNDIGSCFKGIFSNKESLDIFRINDVQELELRKVCCPFYFSKDITQADFYLTSSEGYGMGDIRECFKQRRLIGKHPEGYMVCDIKPNLIGQKYGLGAKDISRIVLTNRHLNSSIFNIKEWPIHVHVAILKKDYSEDTFIIDENDIETIAWAELFKTFDLAKKAQRK
jgi:hypothetical protein